MSYASVEVEPKLIKFKLQTFLTKNNLSITDKCHSRLQTLTKTPAKFQKDTVTITGGRLRSHDTQCLYAVVDVEPKK